MFSSWVGTGHALRLELVSTLPRACLCLSAWGYLLVASLKRLVPALLIPLGIHISFFMCLLLWVRYFMLLLWSLDIPFDRGTRFVEIY